MKQIRTRIEHINRERQEQMLLAGTAIAAALLLL